MGLAHMSILDSIIERYMSRIIAVYKIQYIGKPIGAYDITFICMMTILYKIAQG